VQADLAEATPRKVRLGTEVKIRAVDKRLKRESYEEIAIGIIACGFMRMFVCAGKAGVYRLFNG